MRIKTEFYIVYVEGYEEPMTTVGPYGSYDDAIAAHYQHALDEWPEEEAKELRETQDAHHFYLHDDAVRIARVDRERGYGEVIDAVADALEDDLRASTRAPEQVVTDVDTALAAIEAMFDFNGVNKTPVHMLRQHIETLEQQRTFWRDVAGNRAAANADEKDELADTERDLATAVEALREIEREAYLAPAQELARAFLDRYKADTDLTHYDTQKEGEPDTDPGQKFDRTYHQPKWDG